MGRFRSYNVENMVELGLSDGSTVHVTDVHLFWSDTRNEWIEAGQLKVSEELNALDGPVSVRSLERRQPANVVYNLEVHGHHVHRVDDCGVLVHNVDPNGAPVKTASESLPQFKGMSEAQVRKKLQESGCTQTHVSNSAARNETWKHPDGSEVRIHPYGNAQQSPYKTANNAHVHKEDPLGRQLNNRGLPNTNPNETHIGIPNPPDLPQVRGRPHGTGTQ